MNPINKFLEDELGARPAPEPAPIAIRPAKKPFEKVVGESKAARRMRRKALFR